MSAETSTVSLEVITVGIDEEIGKLIISQLETLYNAFPNLVFDFILRNIEVENLNDSDLPSESYHLPWIMLFEAEAISEEAAKYLQATYKALSYPSYRPHQVELFPILQRLRHQMKDRTPIRKNIPAGTMKDPFPHYAND